MYLLTHVRYFSVSAYVFLQYFKALQLKGSTLAFLITSSLPSDLILFLKLSSQKYLFYVLQPNY